MFIEFLPGVDNFELTVLGEGLRVSSKSGSVPAIVTGKLHGEVGRRLAREWTQILDTVRSVP